MMTYVCTPGYGLRLTATGSPKDDRTSASAVYVLLADLWGGRFWDPNCRPAGEGERVRSVSPAGEAMIAARARAKLDGLVRRGLVADLTVTAVAVPQDLAYDLTIEYLDRRTGARETTVVRERFI